MAWTWIDIDEVNEDDLGDGDDLYVTTTGGTGDDGSFGYDE